MKLPASAVVLQEESTWVSEDDPDVDLAMDMDTSSADAGPSSAGADPADSREAQASGEHADAGYINVFLLKYVCPQANCFGTMVPLHCTTQYECNMCGFKRSDAEFLADLEAQWEQ
jgi:SET and MYND domain-containing protein